jgi:7-cyano-7-deazaguanine synthase in queuosine biosynthesis
MKRSYGPNSHVVTYRATAERKQHAVQWGSDLTVDGRGVSERLSDDLPTNASDLLVVAVSLYAVDRMVARPRGRSVEYFGDWSRELSVDVPVSAPGRWTSLATDLNHLLRWLTDDNWDVTFSERVSKIGPFDQPQQALFSAIPLGTRPILFSGGLDSACTLYSYASQRESATISVHTNSWMQNTQDEVRRRLASSALKSVTPLSFRACLPARGVENSQRTRGILFLASGAMAAIAAGADGFVVAENGVGAINLPYVPAQIGSQATKSMHPQTIRMMADLVSKLTGKPFWIETPNMLLTKAEIIRKTDIEADAALAYTVSCDKGFAARVKDRMPCGGCTSCILRRQALNAAGRAAIDSRLSYRSRAVAETSAFAAMAWQAHRLRRCFASSDSWGELLREFPDFVHLTGVVAPDEAMRLYDEYVNEFAQYLHALGVDATWR